MAKCGYCGSTIIIGGVRAGNQRFCNARCHGGAAVLSVTKDIPPELLDREVTDIWRGTCPKCGRYGPVDVHKFHEVWSAVVLTRWTTKAQVSCHPCAVKRQLGGVAFSLVCGWWGLPWGLILTPVQVTRNVIGICAGPSTARPSEELRRHVLVNIDSQILAKQKAANPAPPK